MGGVIGLAYNYCPVDSCSNTGELFNAGSHFGGVIGRISNGSPVTRCENYGVMADTNILGTVYDFRGGVIGSIAADTAFAMKTCVEDCANHAPMRLHSRYMGGVVGYVEGYKGDHTVKLLMV